MDTKGEDAPLDSTHGSQMDIDDNPNNSCVNGFQESTDVANKNDTEYRTVQVADIVKASLKTENVVPDMQSNNLVNIKECATMNDCDIDNQTEGEKSIVSSFNGSNNSLEVLQMPLNSENILQVDSCEESTSEHAVNGINVTNNSNVLSCAPKEDLGMTCTPERKGKGHNIANQASHLTVKPSNEIGGLKSSTEAHSAISIAMTSPVSESSTPTRSSQRKRQRKHSLYEEVEDTPPIPQKQDIVPKEKVPPLDRPIKWLEGDLVWSLVSGHPIWPCIIAKDPFTETYTKLKGSGTKSNRMYHVQFFGDSPEHAWVTERSMHKFSSQDEYENIVIEMAKQRLKKQPKVEIPKRFQNNWNAGVEEIATALPLSNENRITKFLFRYTKDGPRKFKVNERNSEEAEGDLSSIVEIKQPVGKEIVSNKSCQKPKDRKQNENDVKTDSLQNNHQENVSFVNEDCADMGESKRKLDEALIDNNKGDKKARIRSSAKSALPARPLAYDPPTISATEIEGSRTPYECMYCPDIYFSLLEMREHCKKKHPKQEMLIQNANKGKGSPAQLKAQSNTKVSTPVDVASGVACPLCDSIFASKRALGQHRRFSHANGLIAETESAVNLSSMSEDTKDDEASETNDSGVPCPQCTSVFANKRALGQHRRFSHPNGLVTELEFVNSSASSEDIKVIDTTVAKSRPRSLLVTQVKKEPVCAACETGGDTVPCSGECFRSYHRKCLGDDDSSSTLLCKECKAGNHNCIICCKVTTNVDLGELKRCVVPLCGRSFHSTCLQIHNLKGISCSSDKFFGSGSSTRCPSHVCATCLSKTLSEATKKGENPQKLKSTSKSRLFKCVRCPTAYHADDECIAAGSIILCGINIVCPLHFNPIKTVPHHHPVHISWCFVCSKGGELICCSTCPATFHAQCINLEKPPDGDWQCLDCSCGIRPLYNDIVWVKLGTYRWWPGEVTHPDEIPDNISRLNHGPGEFVVRFFGSNDYFWLNKYRAFLYQEGDNGATNRHCSKGISGVFKRALQEADERFSEITSERQRQKEEKTAKNDKKPAPYKHIRFNKPIGRVQIQTADISEIPRCVCKRTDPNPCSPESECLNRMLMYECHPAMCPGGDRCDNQKFQKCDYPETEVFKTHWGGWGLRTKQFIKKGDFVNEYVGELVDEEECKKRIDRSHDQNVTNFYMLTIDKDRIIDAGPKGNYSRFMNHCCDPNCETQKWLVNGDTRVGLFAIKDMLPDEELTFNYNLDCLGNDKTKCMCGSSNCSGFIGVRPKAQSQDGVVKKERKKKRKPRRAESIPQHDDFCFRCRQTGTLVCCDFKSCMRAFCLDCLNIEKPPYGKWECPCHHCDWCGRRAQYFCSFCPNSFCGSHVKNQLRPSVPNKFDTCLDHEPETAEFEMAETIATVNKLVNSGNAFVVISTDDSQSDASVSDSAPVVPLVYEDKRCLPKRRGRPKKSTPSELIVESKISDIVEVIGIKTNSLKRKRQSNGDIDVD